MNKTINIMETKKCTKCGVENNHTTDFFHKSKGGINGLASRCKLCARMAQKEYFKRNPKAKENQLKASRKWFSLNKSKASESSKKWREKNQEKVKGYTIAYREKQKVNDKKHRARRKDEIKLYKIGWLKDNPDKAAASRKKQKEKVTKNLPDSLIKEKIKRQTGLQKEDITPEMIKTKRLLIFIKREIKNHRNESK